MCPEQKYTVCMKDTLEKETKTGKMAFAAYAGTFIVAKACIFHLKFRSSIRCKVNPSCAAKVMSSLILLYALQMLSEKPGIDGDENACSSAMVCIKAVGEIEV